MSAWPEAVWIVKEVSASLNAEEKISNLSQRLQAIEHRHVYVATSAGGVEDPSKGAVLLRIYQ